MYVEKLRTVASYIFYVTISNMSLLVSFGKDKSDGACGIESSQLGYLKKYLCLAKIKMQTSFFSFRKSSFQ